MKINLLVGDRSGDGHDKREHFLIECNLDVAGVQKAYKKAVKLVGFDFSNEVAAEYEDSRISHEQLKKLRELGYDGELFDEKYMADGACGLAMDGLEFAHIYMFFVWLGNKDIVWEFVDAQDATIDIGGYGIFE